MTYLSVRSAPPVEAQLAAQPRDDARAAHAPSLPQSVVHSRPALEIL